jgi:hypothetical protein
MYSVTNANARLILKGWDGSAAGVIVRLKALAPYALLELILPGGSMVALLLWLYRRQKNGADFGQFAVRLMSFLRLARTAVGTAR